MGERRSVRWASIAWPAQLPKGGKAQLLCSRSEQWPPFSVPEAPCARTTGLGTMSRARRLQVEVEAALKGVQSGCAAWDGLWDKLEETQVRGGGGGAGWQAS